MNMNKQSNSPKMIYMWPKLCQKRLIITNKRNPDLSTSPKKKKKERNQTKPNSTRPSGWLPSNPVSNECCWGCGGAGTLHVVGRSMKWKAAWQVLKKFKVEFTVWFSSSICSYISKRIENMALKKYSYTHAQNNVVHTSQKAVVAWKLVVTL